MTEPTTHLLGSVTAGVTLGTVLCLVAACETPEPVPAGTGSLAGPAQKVASFSVSHGSLSVCFRDNSESPRVLSGVQTLINTAAAPAFDAYDPDGRGASAGLNFEHVIGGHRSEWNKFTPRHGSYDLERLDDGRRARLVRRREDSPWDVSSVLEYTVTAPHYIDIDFRCVPWSRERFGDRGYAIFFFANYINDVADVALHFLGIDPEDGDGTETWIAADGPPGHPDWNRGGTYRHRDAAPLHYDDDVDFRLNTWSYDSPRFTRPFYYGRAARGMVFILMFDRAHALQDEIRFSIFKFKLPEKPRPAWDFQYVIHRVEAGKRYGFRARVVWKKWVSREDCLAEYERWSGGLRAKP